MIFTGVASRSDGWMERLDASLHSDLPSYGCFPSSSHLHAHQSPRHSLFVPLWLWSFHVFLERGQRLNFQVHAWDYGSINFDVIFPLFPSIVDFRFCLFVYCVSDALRGTIIFQGWMSDVWIYVPIFVPDEIINPSGIIILQGLELSVIGQNFNMGLFLILCGAFLWYDKRDFSQ